MLWDSGISWARTERASSHNRPRSTSSLRIVSSMLQLKEFIQCRCDVDSIGSGAHRSMRWRGSLIQSGIASRARQPTVPNPTSTGYL